MQSKSYIICGYSLIAGIFGAFVHWLQSLSIYEESGLVTPLATWSIVLILFVGAILGVLAFLTYQLKDFSFRKSYPDCARCFSPYDKYVIIALGAIFFLLSALTVIKALKPEPSLLDFVFGFMGVLFAPSIYVYFTSAKKDENSVGAQVSAVIMVLFFALRLIVFYKNNADDPVLWDFALSLLGSSLSLLGIYYAVGFNFRSPQPMKTVFFCLAAAALTIVGLADKLSVTDFILNLASAIFMAYIPFLHINNVKTFGKQ